MIYKETVCTMKSCQQTECKHHICHVPQCGIYKDRIISEVEYDVDNFAKNGTCPYGKKRVFRQGKGVAE